MLMRNFQAHRGSVLQCWLLGLWDFGKGVKEGRLSEPRKFRYIAQVKEIIVCLSGSAKHAEFGAEH